MSSDLISASCREIEKPKRLTPGQWEVYYRESWPFVIGLVAKLNRIWKVGIADDEVQDLAQNVFVKAFENFDPCRGISFEVYSRSIVKGLVIDSLRRAIARPKMISLDSATTSDSNETGEAAPLNLASQTQPPDKQAEWNELVADLEGICNECFGNREADWQEVGYLRFKLEMKPREIFAERNNYRALAGVSSINQVFDLIGKAKHRLKSLMLKRVTPSKIPTATR